ncbi:energy-coupling factor transporter transmembrane component T family protein [Paenibacillus campinasensis]|uniref:Cobalt transporter n=1 Tax=Paenibacillus campinasensis TaxID=66347 RepID=A0A268EZ78_9BACL|nr:energy-coupling factor transporter transmembrane component T [Paenibacillus campinasensis]MUG65160.1 energy-coupling factor transporter transmembrane protein EcfT [Paenibacillus campinasensis]PAD78427.1 cobalt transporter [Paenibacillus campinasensis]
MQLVRSWLNKITIERIQLELMNTAYGSGHASLSRLDPRCLLIWYLFFAIVPWFISNLTVLAGMFLMMVVTTILSRVTPFIILVLCLGLIGQVGWLFILSLFFGGDISSALPLLKLTLKLSVVSLASITVFSGMDPEKISDGLLALGMPAAFSFSLSYGYRILPVLFEEFRNVLLSYRLRGKAPEEPGVMYWRMAAYYLKLLVLSFFPLMLATAKRSRTTVEALETRGFSYGMKNPAAKKLKLAHLKVSTRDIMFLSGSAVYVSLLFWISGRL